MRNLHYLSIMVAVILGLAACSKETGSKLPPVQMELFLAAINEMGDITTVLLDDGREYAVISTEESQYEHIKSSYIRAVGFIEIINDLEVKVYSLARIPVIIPLAEAPEYGVQDPVEVKRVWLGGGFLNFELGIKTNNYISHVLTLHEEQSVLDNLVTVNITLYHDRKSTGVGATMPFLASIPLNRYRSEASNLKLNFKLNTYKGMMQFSYLLKL